MPLTEAQLQAQAIELVKALIEQGHYRSAELEAAKEIVADATTIYKGFKTMGE